jgi:hypothetical protein
MSINPVNSHQQVSTLLNLAMKSFSAQQDNIMKVFQEFVQENAKLSAQSARTLSVIKEMQEKTLPILPANFFFIG